MFLRFECHVRNSFPSPPTPITPTFKEKPYKKMQSTPTPLAYGTWFFTTIQTVLLMVSFTKFQVKRALIMRK
jgi:hypothetical protein